MQRKVAVSGDVSQLVTGNVVHEAPATVHQQHNTITYQLHREPQYLSWRQRQVISGKVDDIANAEGMERLAVYKTLLSEHGAPNMKAMPADRFRAIMDDLTVWLNEAKSRSVAANDSDSMDGGTAAPSSSNQLPASVPRRPSRLSTIHWLLSICAAVVGSVLAWERVSAEPTIAQDMCHFEGRPYSVGSLATMASNAIFECQAVENASPKWVPARNLGSGGKRRQ